MSNIFGERLEMLMKEQNLSQVQLADALEIKKQSINSYIKGKSRPELDVLMRFADFFDCSVDYLLGREDFRSYQHIKNYDEMLEKNFCDSLNFLSADKREYYLEIITRFTNSFQLTAGKSYNMKDFNLSTEVTEQMNEIRLLNAQIANITSESKPITFSIGSGETITVDSHSAEYVLILTNLIHRKVAETCHSIKALGDIGVNTLEKCFPQVDSILNLSQYNAERVANEFSDKFFGISSDEK